jgi:hypothetical protein
MPLAIIKRAQEETGLALEKLEEYWEKAKEIAKARTDIPEDAIWAYTTGIFKNMTSLNSDLVVNQQTLMSLSRDLRIPVSRLNQHWSNASGRASGYKAIRIFENFLLSESRPERKEKIELPDWWTSKTDRYRETYLKNHPRSKFAGQIAKKRKELAQKLGKKESEVKLEDVEKAFDTGAPEKGVDEKDKKDKPSEKHNAQERADDVDEKKQEKEELDAENPVADEVEETAAKRKEDDEERTIEKDGKKESVFSKRPKGAIKMSLKQKLMSVWSSKKGPKQKVHNVLRHHKQGLQAIGKLMAGKEATPVEWMRAKRTAGLAAKLVIGTLGVAVVGAAMFSPLAGHAAEIGEMFLNSFTGVSESSEKEPNETEAGTDDFLDSFHEWLLDQDPQELLKEAKKMSKSTKEDGAQQ